MHEWPLLIFTLFIQIAIGLSVLTLLSYCLPATQRQQMTPPFTLRLLFIMLGLASVGLLASTSHLGVVLNAPNALRNPWTSWLSREIFATSAYAGLLSLTLARALFFKHLSRLLLAITALAGLVDIFVMGSVYRYTSIATWTHPNTYVMFYSTAFLAAAAVYALLLQGYQRKITPLTIPNANRYWQRWLWLIMLLAFALRFGYQPHYIEYLTQAQLTTTSVTFPLDPIGAYNAIEPLRLIGWLLSLIGIMLCGGHVIRGYFPSRYLSQAKRPLPLFTLGCLCIVVAEGILRYVFYTLQA